jgi:Ni2+-binding GTPase involved in maturation of urease and hydrogenase
MSNLTRYITVSGPPSSGKTSVLVKTLSVLQRKGYHTAVLKFDCLTTDDAAVYESNTIDVRVGISGNVCPDHYFINNIDEGVSWACEQNFDFVVSESAGLCSRCSPHIEGITAVCVVDCLMGINAPKKIGPMLKTADIVVITRGDIVSQAEREIFALKVQQANPSCRLLFVNGITGQGTLELATMFEEAQPVETVIGSNLRVSMPSALCSYCLGETCIGNAEQKNNQRRMFL